MPSTLDQMSDPAGAYDPSSQQMGVDSSDSGWGAMVGNWLSSIPGYLPPKMQAVTQGAPAIAKDVATLPQRAIESAQNVGTDQYDPGPILEAAGLPFGGTAFSAPELAAGEAALGAGPVRQSPTERWGSDEAAARAADYPEAGAFEMKERERKKGESKEAYEARLKRLGKEYPSKVLTPQEQELSDFRTFVMKDMAKNPDDWKPSFPRQQRYNIPKGTHPDPIDTELAKPAKGTTVSPEEKRSILKNPEAEKILTNALKAGNANPESHNWYAMGQLQQAFNDEYGDNLGPLMFRRFFSGPMAATTAGADPTTNLLQSAFGNWLRMRGDKFPTRSYELPYPVGGGQFSAAKNMAQYEKMIGEGEPAIDLENPKRLNFQQALQGDPRSFTWDQQMLKGVGVKEGVVPQNRYGLWERFGRNWADRMARRYRNQYPDLTPAEVQGRAWAGLKGQFGPPMIEHFNRAIERTRRITGLSPQEIISRYMRGAMPLYGLAGLAYMAAHGKNGAAEDGSTNVTQRGD